MGGLDIHSRGPQETPPGRHFTAAAEGTVNSAEGEEAKRGEQ